MDFLPDYWQVMTIRLLLAAIFCGLIGLEREVKGHPAGFRTHLLVGIGSCLMMLLSNYGFEDFMAAHENARMDPARLPAYVVSGIGFLGAGTILVHGIKVKGLTTAASIWVVAGIGLVVGNGMYYAAILATVVVILSLLFLNKLEGVFINKPNVRQLNIVIENKSISIKKVVELVERQRMSVEKVSVEDYRNNRDRDYMKVVLMVKTPKEGVSPDMFDQLNEHDHIYKVYT
ncbi:putative Mg2+ transporter-C (MgtC) family protein [Pullulanibacillus pueri]|uniref:Magnesium transporter MgtC n=1 Tax=Pullulanibacillus pueri TaxID=1437324 RepID=A0A8J3EPQ6_9BACL|nr:MgtC/SapB family protein [Pullulanibacillus pueri]MBM7683675.1 putative Mg2+ transporter-C (MgtC) family protein [Pullulanibacillus pueri]GGH87150.1 magnesium transporter MgtC [Pullulanibacillus pueri]